MSYFADREFFCKCGRAACDKQIGAAPELLRVLNVVRDAVGRPVIIRSGNRCDYWNRQNRGADDGEHERQGGCQGADLEALRSRDRFELVTAALRAGVTRLGIGRDFVHVGVGATPADAPEVIWTYYPQPGGHA